MSFPPGRPRGTQKGEAVEIAPHGLAGLLVKQKGHASGDLVADP
jgi:hypothetical protein